MKHQSLLLLLSFCLLTCFSCKDKQSPQEQISQEECVANFLAQSEQLNLYAGQDWIEGGFSFLLFEYDAGFYFLLDHPLIDLNSIPLDCNAEPLCGGDNQENCYTFNQGINAQYVTTIDGL